MRHLQTLLSGRAAQRLHRISPSHHDAQASEADVFNCFHRLPTLFGRSPWNFGPNRSADQGRQCLRFKVDEGKGSLGGGLRKPVPLSAS